jgi:hypothetical protein
LSDLAYRFQLSTWCFLFFMQTSFLLIPWCAWFVRLTCIVKCGLALGCSRVFTHCFQDSFDSMICSEFFVCNYMSMLLFEINLQAFWEGFCMQTGSRSTKKGLQTQPKFKFYFLK